MSYLELTFVLICSIKADELCILDNPSRLRQSSTGSSVVAVALSVMSTYMLLHTMQQLCISNDDVFCKFLETEESCSDQPTLTHEKCSVLQHFESNHPRMKAGRFVGPLTRKLNAEPLGESRFQAVQRFWHWSNLFTMRKSFVNTGVLLHAVT